MGKMLLERVARGDRSSVIDQETQDQSLARTLREVGYDEGAALLDPDTPVQAKGGPDAIASRFERVAWPLAASESPPDAPAVAAVDLQARMRALWAGPN